MKYTPARLKQSVRSRLGIGPSVVSQRLLGHDVKARFGLTKGKPDYDYGWVYALITQCAAMLDVGCNVGLDSLVACLDDPQRQVVAIDANPRALATAAENLFLNNISRQVRFVLGFVSDRDDTEVNFFTVGTGAAGSRFRSVAQTASRMNSFFKVRTFTLDELTGELGFTPDFIKIDVEGAEVEVLRGAKRLVQKCRPRIIVEMHRTDEFPMHVQGENVLAWCGEVDYSAFYLPEHKQVSSPGPFAHRGRCHLLLQPSGLTYPPHLKDIPESSTMEFAQALIASRLGV